MDLDELPAWLDERPARGEFSEVVLPRRGLETLFEHAADLASRAHTGAEHDDDPARGGWRPARLTTRQPR